MVENNMVRDESWAWQERDVEPLEEEIEKGYHELGTHTFVADEDAFEYALDRCMNGSEEEQRDFKELLVEWFYSGGSWVREE